MQIEEYRKIISSAIEKEVEAYEFYAGVAAKVTSRVLKDIFSELAEEEKKHKSTLEGYLADLKPPTFDATRDYRVSETVQRPTLKLDMKPVDAVALAMKKEEDAMNMYTALAENSSGQEQKEMFQSLAAMEKGHKAKLEDMYTNMAFPEVW
jgi:rubrerythrin